MGAFGALNTVLVGVSGNLIANQFQQWVDMRNAASSDEAFTAQLANDLHQQAREDSKLRDALDEINTKLELLQQLPTPTADTAHWQAQLLQTLRAELTQLGNAERYAEALTKIENSGSGAVAVDGGIAAGQNGIAAKKVNAKTINTGDTHNHYYAPESSTDTNPESFIHNSLFSDYLHALRTECDALPLAAMGGETGAGRELCLGDVYIELNTTARRKMTEDEIAEGKKKAEENKSHFDEEQEVIIKAQEAAENTHLLLLGDPGSGKSTFVRQLTAKHAAHLLTDDQPPTANSQQPFLPIFVILHELIPGLDALHQDADFRDARRREQDDALTNLLVAEWNRWLDDKRLADFGAELETMARTTQPAQPEKPQLLLVLDGLDEVPEQLRSLLYQMVAALPAAFPNIARVIVTCRVRSYFQGMLPRFESFTLADFTDEQISNFVTAWYRTQQGLGRMDQRRADQQIADLQQAANGNLRELAQNPMLLTTMTIVHQKETKLPDQRVELYNLAVDVLMNRWQQNKDQITALSPQLDELLADSRKLRRILERLAYEAHKAQASRGENGQENEEEEGPGRQQPLRRGDLLVLLEDLLEGDNGLANEFLDYIDHRAGLLVGRGGVSEDSRLAVGRSTEPASILGANRKPPTYTFPHRTFQEYLAGCHMNHGREYIRTYERHVKEGDFWRVAALLGAEELYYNNKNETDVLDLAYALCPSPSPRTEDDWRSLAWSAQVAALLGKSVIANDDKNDGGTHYLGRLIERLVELSENTHLTPLERAEAGDALGALGDPRFNPKAWFLPAEPDLGFADVGAGKFVMGSNDEMDYKAQPQHNLQLDRFLISRYQVTVAQWRIFCHETGHAPSDSRSLGNQPSHPVRYIAWNEAMAYCEWLTEQLRSWDKTPEPLATLLRQGDGDGPPWQLTLPSEAQWERAARGTDGRIYPWGNGFDAEKCNTFESGIMRPIVVGWYSEGKRSYRMLGYGRQSIRLDTHKVAK